MKKSLLLVTLKYEHSKKNSKTNDENDEESFCFNTPMGIFARHL